MYGRRQHAKPAKREGKHIPQAFDVGLRSRKTKRENAPFSVDVNKYYSKYCGNKQPRDPEDLSRQSWER